MIKVKKEGILLYKTSFEFENEGVLNPAVIREGDNVYLFYRAVQQGNRSSIGYCKLDGPLTVVERWDKPLISSEFEYESQGVEDARIVKIDDLYYLTYTGYDGTNARGALATSKDLKQFKKQGLIVPPITYAEFVFLAETAGKVNENYYRNYKFYYQEVDPEKKIMLWDKNVIFFPRRIKGKLVFLHRIRPGIQIVSIDNLSDLTKEFWENYFINLQDHIVMDPVFPHELSYIGSGCPPIETEHGWLLIYHGVKETKKGLVYSACAALLDLNNPSIELSRLPNVFFSPEYDWELKGEVNNVVFPTGTAIFGNTLFIYYGAADTCIACASVSLPELLAELLIYKNKNE
ncbi:MAG: pesticidal protein Cry7Aa [Bacteroidetes bacterium RIFOXYA12_FULL_35_11]|nr:MAG: pesticidal protein Cry7Aa [Bacteroidetes bacterium GWF2_35_48]OFY80787.1 MAG: pesticidal protein Cry7Aa [Bacteroidetes bacterium RIFOXYA12_FULL_35_11]OFY97070.1 MAG: pesticidal protein Cry7Aa [Bacteroidetes bacterium RIFOXYB2_FULL_35_7]OFZ04659.1 MAG: pesticidal protein Cry7Aa [Bacteroidetes bacterium RIFOXYC12_FULL_35_7]HBX50065.1 pesticidal protein Cry7Aa [Bacteroidales bacterium]